MWYSFTETIYSALNEDDVNKLIKEIDKKTSSCRKSAEELIKNFREVESDKNGIFHLMGAGVGAKDKIRGTDLERLFKTNLELFSKCKSDKTPVYAAEDRFEIANGMKPIGLYRCIYTYFFITENFKVNGSKKDFYEKLLTEARIPYSPSLFSSMNDLVMRYVIESDQDSTEWKALMDDWGTTRNDKDDEDHKVYKPKLTLPLSDSNISPTMNDLCEILEKQNEEEVIQETRHSLSIISQAYNSALNSKKGITEISKLFSKEIIQLVLDAELRRQWYFLRLVRKIVDKQIEAIVSAYKRKDSYEFDNLKKIMWLGTNSNDEIIGFNETWSEVSTESGYTDEEIEGFLRNSRIIPSRISLWLGRLVDFTTVCRFIPPEGNSLSYEFSNPVSFMPARYNYSKYGIKTRKINKALRCDNTSHCQQFRVIERENSKKTKIFYVKTQNAVIRVPRKNNLIPRVPTQRGTQPLKSRIRTLLTKKTGDVTRDMLLLMVLAANVYGVDLTRKYVDTNVLFNSRYSADFLADATENSAYDEYPCNDFEDYFNKVFYDIKQSKGRDILSYDLFLDRVLKMQDYSADLEEYYLRSLRIPAFKEIMEGKNIEW